VAQEHLPAIAPKIHQPNTSNDLEGSKYFVKDGYYIPYHELTDETLLEVAQFILSNNANVLSKNRIFVHSKVKWSPNKHGAVITYGDVMVRWLRQCYIIFRVDVSDKMLREAGHSFRSWKQPLRFVNSFKGQHVAASLIAAIDGPQNLFMYEFVGLWGFRKDPRFAKVFEPCINFVVTYLRPQKGTFSKDHLIERCNPAAWRDQARARIKLGFWAVPAMDECLDNHLMLNNQQYEMKELEQMVSRMIYEYALLACCVDGPGTAHAHPTSYDLMGWTNPACFFTQRPQTNKDQFDVLVDQMKFWGIKKRRENDEVIMLDDESVAGVSEEEDTFYDAQGGLGSDEADET
jgi:hypothetical protein